MKIISVCLALSAILLLLPETTRAFSSPDKFRLNGFFDLEYERAYSSDDKTLGDTKGSFDQYHFNLLMEFPVSDTLTVKGHIEFEHGPQIKGDKFDVATEDPVNTGNGEIKVEWAYLEYLVNNMMRLRGGMVLTPFGIYNEIHDATPTYVSIRTPWGIYKADKVGGFAMFPKFSTGINLLGNVFTEGDLTVNYVLYIANGENTKNNPAEEDDNSNKAVGGRLMVSPATGIKVGGSFFAGEIGEEGNDHSAWIGSFEYILFPLNIRAEYASSSRYEGTETGWYGEVSYGISMLTPFIRYGALDPNDSTDYDEWTEIVYGINYEIQPGFIFKLENRQFEGNPNNEDIENNYNEFGAAVTVAF